MLYPDWATRLSPQRPVKGRCGHYRQLVGLSLHTFLSASFCCLGIPALSLLRFWNYNLILRLGGCNQRDCAKPCVRLCLGSYKSKKLCEYDPVLAIILPVFRTNRGQECPHNDASFFEVCTVRWYYWPLQSLYCCYVTSMDVFSPPRNICCILSMNQHPK
jgi:hypothetical protein